MEAILEQLLAPLLVLAALSALAILGLVITRPRSVDTPLGSPRKFRAPTEEVSSVPPRGFPLKLTEPAWAAGENETVQAPQSSLSRGGGVAAVTPEWASSSSTPPPPPIGSGILPDVLSAPSVPPPFPRGGGQQESERFTPPVEGPPRRAENEVPRLFSAGPTRPVSPQAAGFHEAETINLESSRHAAVSVPMPNTTPMAAANPPANNVPPSPAPVPPPGRRVESEGPPGGRRGENEGRSTGPTPAEAALLRRDPSPPPIPPLAVNPPPSPVAQLMRAQTPGPGPSPDAPQPVPAPYLMRGQNPPAGPGRPSSGAGISAGPTHPMPVNTSEEPTLSIPGPPGFLRPEGPSAGRPGENEGAPGGRSSEAAPRFTPGGPLSTPQTRPVPGPAPWPQGPPPLPSGPSIKVPGTNPLPPSFHEDDTLGLEPSPTRVTPSAGIPPAPPPPPSPPPLLQAPPTAQAPTAGQRMARLTTSRLGANVVLQVPAQPGAYGISLLPHRLEVIYGNFSPSDPKEIAFYFCDRLAEPCRVVFSSAPGDSIWHVQLNHFSVFPELHAEILCQEDRFSLTNRVQRGQEERFQTRVNGAVLMEGESRVLTPGDIISLGIYRLRFT